MKYEKIITIIFMCLLLVIAFKPNEKIINIPAPNVTITNDYNLIKIAPNVIGLIDTGVNSGKKGQLIILEYSNDTKKFEYVSTFDMQDMLVHPEKYGIPTR